MPKYAIPQNVGKVRVARALGARWVVWNGKQGKGEFTIVCKDREQAKQVCEVINKRLHDGEIEVSNY